LLRAAALNLGFGAVPQLSHLLRAACGGAQKEEKEFFGDTPNPAGGGWPPPCTLRRKEKTVKLTPKGGVPRNSFFAAKGGEL